MPKAKVLMFPKCLIDNNCDGVTDENPGLLALSAWAGKAKALPSAAGLRAILLGGLIMKDKRGDGGFKSFQHHRRDFAGTKDFPRVQHLNAHKLFAFSDVERHLLVEPHRATLAFSLNESNVEGVNFRVVTDFHNVLSKNRTCKP